MLLIWSKVLFEQSYKERFVRTMVLDDLVTSDISIMFERGQVTCFDGYLVFYSRAATAASTSRVLILQKIT